MSEHISPLFEIRVGVYHDKTMFSDVVEVELRNYNTPGMASTRYIRRYMMSGEFVDNVVEQTITEILQQARS